MSDDIVCGVSEGINTLCFNRPDKKNAITSGMYTVLADALRKGDRDDDVAVHLFTGASGVFTAGNDIADFLTMAEGGEFDPNILDFMRALVGAEKPLVAAVDGLAVGIGTTMLLHCDLVYASPKADFRTPFLGLGVLPEAASSLLIPARMGYVRAFEMLCLGMPFDAERAREAGLVNAVVPVDELEAKARDAALALAAKPPEALKVARQLVRGDRSDILARMDEEIVLFKDRMRSPEAKEAFAAFLEKRKPDFTRARAEAGDA